MAAKETCIAAYNRVVKELNSGVVKPVYCLMGDVPYYIDKLADNIVNRVLKPEERDFNLVTFYGSDATAAAVVNAVRGFPMGAKYLVVCVKEAQQLGNLDLIESYLAHLQPTSILILCHKYKSLDKRTKLPNMIAKVGCLVDFSPLYDNQIPDFIKAYARQKSLDFEPKAISMLADAVGADLNRLTGEIDKLSLVANEQKVTPSLIEQHIGISKEFNSFELQEALIRKDANKTFLIAKYFDSNQKKYPIQMTLSVLFKFFSNLMIAYYSPDKTEQGIAAWLGTTSYWVRKDYLPAMRSFSGVKVMRIIGEIRRTDARSKGVDNPNTSNGDLLKELLYYILH